MGKTKIEIGQRATFSNGVAFTHESKLFNLYAVEYRHGMVSEVELKKGTAETKNAFKWLLEGLIEKGGCSEHNKAVEYFRPIKQSGRGQYAKYTKDHTSDYLEAVKVLREVVKRHGVRVEVQKGNDAPKGGKLGNYIKVTAYETSKARIARIQKAINSGDYVIFGYSGNHADILDRERISIMNYDNCVLSRTSDSERICATMEEMNEAMKK